VGLNDLSKFVLVEEIIPSPIVVKVSVVEVVKVRCEEKGRRLCGLFEE
jgi:hypothetical protein